MIDRIRKFFSGLREGEAQGAVFEDRHTAAAALLVEAAHMDGSLAPEEEEAIRVALSRRFDFTPEELDSLMKEGRRAALDSAEIVAFTRAIKAACDYEERVAMLEMLWEVVYADGVLHHYEDNLLRRIGGLLYVSDRDRGEARKRVLDRLGLSDA